MRISYIIIYKSWNVMKCVKIFENCGFLSNSSDFEHQKKSKLEQKIEFSPHILLFSQTPNITTS